MHDDLNIMSLSNLHCSCPTTVHKKPVAGTLWYSDTFAVGKP